MNLASAFGRASASRPSQLSSVGLAVEPAGCLSSCCLLRLCRAVTKASLGFSTIPEVEVRRYCPV